MLGRAVSPVFKILPYVLLIGVVAFLIFRTEPMPTGTHIVAKPAPEVAKVETEAVEIAPPIRVYKPVAKKNLKLPDNIQQDEKKHVIASTKTANDERQHTVTTIIDSSTGESVTYDRVDPQPWLAVNTKSEIGLYYGLKNGSQAIRLEGKQELFQFKALHVGAIGSVDMADGRTDTFVGVGAWARW